MSVLDIPALSLVVLVGASGSGKSTFARQHFGAYETLSSDVFRGLVGGDESDQSATPAAFDALQYVAGKRLDAGLLTVVDATSVQPEARRRLIDLAKAHDVLPVAIVFDLPESTNLARNAERTDRLIPPGVVKRQSDQLRRSLRHLAKEGFRKVHVLRSADEVAAARIERTRLLTDRTDEHGPFDAIGDVHGCLNELQTLLGELGYEIERDERGRAVDARHPEGRRVIFLGDLVDRGPDVVGVLRLAMGMVASGSALAVPGNHEAKLVRALRGARVTPTHGLAETLAQLADETEEFRERVATFCYDLVSHLVLDDGRLVVAHAGLKEQYQGRASGRVRAFALYGETTGETDEFGLPVRYPWAEDYRGSAVVLYGHTPVPRVDWINNTACLDTGCVFGGALSAMRYPEREVVSVPAERVWYEPVRPLVAEAPERAAGVLQLADVRGKVVVETGTIGRVSITEQQMAGGLETMSRWATDPRWLTYLPPTMSPPATSAREGFLEHPDEAFAAFRDHGVSDVICEEKHMGSRAVVLIARDPARFGAPDGWRGSSTPAPAVRSSPPTSRGRCSTASTTHSNGPESGPSSTRTGSCSTARSCPGRRRPGTSSATSSPRWGRRESQPARRHRRCWSGLWHPGSTSRGSRTACASAATISSASATRTGGTSTPRMPCASRRSRCWPPERRRSRRATTAGTCRSRIDWRMPRPTS